MIYLGSALAIAFFAAGLAVFGVVPTASGAVETSRQAVRTLRDSTLSDLEKEREVQRASLSLLGGFASIVIRGGAAFAAAILPLVALQLLGLVRISEVTRWLATWEGIVFTSVVMVLAYLVSRLR